MPNIGDVYVTPEGEPLTLVMLADSAGNYLWTTASGIFVLRSLDGLTAPVGATVPFPAVWININPNGTSAGWSSREEADRRAHKNRIAVLRLGTDGTLELIDLR